MINCWFLFIWLHKHINAGIQPVICKRVPAGAGGSQVSLKALFVSANRPTALCICAWGLSPLTTPLSSQGVSALHPITCPWCVATTHSFCYPREHPVSVVPFTARFVLFLFMELERELLSIEYCMCYAKVLLKRFKSEWISASWL